MRGIYGKVNQQGAQAERRGPEMEQVRDPFERAPEAAAQTNKRLNFLKSYIEYEDLKNYKGFMSIFLDFPVPI